MRGTRSSAGHGAWAWAIALILLSCGKSQDGTKVSASDAPNVVVVLIDTLRADHLGFHGHSKETAPFLAQLSKRSAVFRHAFSTSSWTAPSTASLFTSLYPTQHGIREGFFAHKQRAERVKAAGSTTVSINRLPSSVPILPELFRSAGYTTFGLATNINIGEEIGFDRGFDRFKRLYTLGMEMGEGADAEVVEKHLMDWAAAIKQSEPYFVYLHFNDVHGPYHKRAPWYEPKEDVLEDNKSSYDSEISYLDQALGRIVESFQWDRKAILVVLSDHGQEFMEHGKTGHKFSLYREVNQILLIVSAPEAGIEPRSVEVNVSIIDVVPTLLDLAGLESTPHMVGRSLFPLMRGGVELESAQREFRERPIFAHRASSQKPVDLWAVIYSDWRMIRGEKGLELFDFVQDPVEKSNLIESLPEVVTRLEGYLKEFEAKKLIGEEHSQYELDEDGLETLRTLGYVE